MVMILIFMNNVGLVMMDCIGHHFIAYDNIMLFLMFTQRIRCLNIPYLLQCTAHEVMEELCCDILQHLNSIFHISSSLVSFLSRAVAQYVK